MINYYNQNNTGNNDDNNVVDVDGPQQQRGETGGHVLSIYEKSNPNDDIQIGASKRDLYSGTESDIGSDGHQHKQTRDAAELAYSLHKMVKKDNSQSQSRHTIVNVNNVRINHESRISSAGFMSDNSVGCCDVYEEFRKEDLNATPENGSRGLANIYNINSNGRSHRSSALSGVSGVSSMFYNHPARCNDHDRNHALYNMIIINLTKKNVHHVLLYHFNAMKH